MGDPAGRHCNAINNGVRLQRDDVNVHAALLKGEGRVHAAADCVEIISQGHNPGDASDVMEAGQVGDLVGHGLGDVRIDEVEEPRRVQGT